MATPAAMLAVQVQAQGIQRTANQLRGLHGDLDNTGQSAVRTGASLDLTGKRGVRAFALLKGAAAAGAVAIGAIAGAGIKKAIDAASDLGEQVNKTKVVFRGSEQQVLSWSKGTATGIGLSQRAALEAAGTFGNMLVPMGFARKEAAGMSTKMVGLAGDLASFNNASPEDTLEALRAGLAGETEPLRKFGVFLNDARLKQEAMSLGLYKGKGNLTAAAKAQATYSLILKDSKDAQGDFANTSNSLANRQRILKAQIENIAAALGKALLPAATAVASGVSDLIAGFQAGTGAGGQLRDVFLALKGAIGGVISTISAIVGWFKQHQTVTMALAAAAGTVTAALVTLRVVGLAAQIPTLAATAAAWIAANAAMLANPAVLIVIGLAALVAALVVAYRESETFRNIVNAVFNAVREVAGAVFGFLKFFIPDAWNAIKSATTGVWNAVSGFLSGLWGGIRGAASSVWNGIRNVIGGAVDAAGDAIRGTFGAVSGFLSAVWGGIRGAASGAWSAVKSTIDGAVDGALNAVRNSIGAVRDFMSNVWSAIRERVSGAWDGIVDTIRGFVGRARSVAENVGDAIKDAISNAVSGLGGIVSGAFSGAMDAIKGPVNHAIKLFNKLPGPNLPLLAGGARNFAGGMAIVGERGPELVNLPRGADVFSNRESRAMIANTAPAVPAGPIVQVGELHVHGEADLDATFRRFAWAVETA